MTKELIQIESWLSEYLILEKRIESLYKQAQRPHLREMFLKMGPKGDKNIAVDTDKINVQGGHKPVMWATNLEGVYARVKEMSDDITSKLQACLAQQAEIMSVVDSAGLDHEEYLYIEQRDFEGLSVKEMERNGCGETKLLQIKRAALQKIYDERCIVRQSVAKSG